MGDDDGRIRVRLSLASRQARLLEKFAHPDVILLLAEGLIQSDGYPGLSVVEEKCGDQNFQSVI